jgi:tol-pal system protein YbgF
MSDRSCSLNALLTALVLVTGSGASCVHAQDYIDLEAERSDEPTRSYGMDSARAAPAARGPAPAGSGAGEADQSVGRLLIQLQQLQQDVMRLNGKVEEQAHELRQLKEQSLERYLDLDRRLAGGSGDSGGGSSESAGGGSIATTADTAGDSTAEQPGEGDAYRAAYALVRGQEFEAAVAAFKQFLDRFPDGRYAPNAHYWLGELYLVLQPPDPEAARQSFTLLLDQYPGNPKEPDALYKLGRVHFIKGNRGRAREFLDRVIREHPDSSAAGLAGEFIDQNL